jgi:hypothetical protein
MFGASPSRLIRQTAPAVGLSILAVLFAVEAKLAWYSPLDILGRDVCAAKACPANTPKVVAHGIASSDSAPRPITVFHVTAFAVVVNAQMNLLLGRNFKGKTFQACRADYSSINPFFNSPLIL